MMKKSFFLSVIVIIVLTGTFQSCENEPAPQLDKEDPGSKAPAQTSSSRSYVKMDDIPDVIGSLEKRMGSKVSRSGGILGNKISAKDYEVYLDSIARVVNQGSDTNYTFALDVKGSGPNEFYNLVVGKMPDGGIKDPIVVKYALDPEDMDYFMNGGTDLKRLNATYSYYNFERFFNEGLKLTASGTGDCGSGYIGGGGGGGPMVPPGGSIQTSGFGITSTTTFQTGGVTNVPYNFNISVTDANGNTEVSTGYATSQNLSSTFSTTYGQGDAQVSTYPPTTATINQDTRATQGQNGTIGGGCMSSSYLDGAGWQISGCEFLGTGDGNKGGPTLKEGDCDVPEGTMATLTTFTLMILNKTSGYIGLNLAVPVDWSRYIWLSHRVIPVCIPINQFVEGNGQSSEAKNLAGPIQLAMMDNLEVINFAPLVKYPENSNYDILYPRLTEYLKNQLPLVANITKITNALQEITQLPVEQIKNDLQWGEGPIIIVQQLDNYTPGQTNHLTAGLFDPDKPDNIYLDIDYINKVENEIDDPDALIFWLGTTILHEFAHRDYITGYDYPGEEGVQYEIKVYGENVTINNARLILDRLE